MYITSGKLHFSVPADRLANFQIGATTDRPVSSIDLNSYNVCASNDGPMGAGETRAFACSAVGRYVIVQLRGTNPLTLCEVKVMGSKL